MEISTRCLRPCWYKVVGPWLLILLLAGCANQLLPARTPVVSQGAMATALPTEVVVQVTTEPIAAATEVLATSTGVVTATIEVRPTPTVDPDRGPFPEGEEARCGVLLPVLAAPGPAPITNLDSNQSLEPIPKAARPAVARILEAPGTVGLVAYEIGQEEAGIFFNGDVPMPLASVVKIIHLVAYAEAVQAGEVDPQMEVPLAELEKYYLANSDLNAHPQAVTTLRSEGLIVGEPEAVLLETVPRMMIEYSSNAATDYLHQLLGQKRIEQTIVDLGLQRHTAPCPFLGQFLLMGTGDGIAEVEEYVADPARYSRAVWEVTETYVAGESSAEEWRGRWRRPSVETQAYFSEMLNAKANAADYARLMAQIAENQLGPWEQNVRIRRYLEWPTFFEVNQQTLAWLGYKGGALPGILTVAYYAQPWDTVRPVVVVLFFRDLPRATYREWRRKLPHDELARWLLYEREAMPLLRQMLEIEE